MQARQTRLLCQGGGLVQTGGLPRGHVLGDRRVGMHRLRRWQLQQRERERVHELPRRLLERRGGRERVRAVPGWDVQGRRRGRVRSVPQRNVRALLRLLLLPDVQLAAHDAEQGVDVLRRVRQRPLLVGGRRRRVRRGAVPGVLLGLRASASRPNRAAAPPRLERLAFERPPRSAATPRLGGLAFGTPPRSAATPRLQSGSAEDDLSKNHRHTQARTATTARPRTSPSRPSRSRSATGARRRRRPRSTRAPGRTTAVAAVATAMRSAVGTPKVGSSVFESRVASAASRARRRRASAASRARRQRASAASHARRRRRHAVPQRLRGVPATRKMDH